MVYGWKEHLLDWLVADDCLLCGARGNWGLCVGCRAELPWNSTACRRCALPLPPLVGNGTLCRHCARHPPAFDRALAPLRFAGVVADLVREFKYQRCLAAGRLLGAVLAGALQPAAEGRGDVALPDVLIPTPLHPRRLRERGFNQAAELTRVLSGRLEVPWQPGRFRRLLDTPSQTGLGRGARRRTLRGAFAWRGDVGWRSVAVIDDVVTSGATAQAMAATLKRAGFARVEVWAVARTPLPSALRDGRDSPSTGPI